MSETTEKLLREANHRCSEQWRELKDLRQRVKDAEAHVRALRGQLYWALTERDALRASVVADSATTAAAREALLPVSPKGDAVEALK